MKEKRHNAIREILKEKEISSQEELIAKLINRDINVTQATLSRDIRELKISKVPNKSGVYIYKEEDLYTINFGYLSIEFSLNLAVMKTKPGFAMGIASEIDQKISNEIIGTVAGDDTILLIIKEGITHESVLKSLSDFFTGINIEVK